MGAMKYSYIDMLCIVFSVVYLCLINKVYASECQSDVQVIPDQISILC